MSNSTIANIANNSTIGGWEVSTLVLGILFFTSEVLPFLRKRDKNNGILDSLICLLKGSECVTGKIAETLEKVQDNKDVKIDLEDPK
jgi:hypothetical protein